MAFLHPDITCETEDLHIERYTRLALLLLFGGVLFPNTSESLVSMRFLHHLQQLDDLPLYSWGATILAYLYRSMCWASMLCQVDICGLGLAVDHTVAATSTTTRARDVLDILVAGQAIGHHLVYQLGQEIQQHADSAALVEYGRRVEDLARRTLFQARDGARLDHEAQYAAPDDYHRGRVVP
uniref:Uncharacterized protein LOC104223010 n=1 Tax=Nicotiana sylvestris TaxID=4096 RepID=A0A1U7W222_NICSY|nr:PREDICTED: uncharacterized protein LOC104223010 [Nicotiana sylvestris]